MKNINYRIKKIISLVSLSLLFACASSEQYTKFSHNKELNNDQARLYVIRPSGYGSAVKFKIYGNGKLVGRLGPKSYLCWDVPTGEYSLKSTSSNSDSATVKTEVNKTYYIQAKIDMSGVGVAKTEFRQMDEADALKKVSKLKKPKIKYFE